MLQLEYNCFKIILTPFYPPRARLTFTHKHELGETKLFIAADREKHFHVPKWWPVLWGTSYCDQRKEGVQLWDFAPRGDRRDTSPVWSGEKHLHTERRTQGGQHGEPAERRAIRGCWKREIQKARVRTRHLFCIFLTPSISFKRYWFA